MGRVGADGVRCRVIAGLEGLFASAVAEGRSVDAVRLGKALVELAEGGTLEGGVGGGGDSEGGGAARLAAIVGGAEGGDGEG